MNTIEKAAQRLAKKREQEEAVKKAQAEVGAVAAQGSQSNSAEMSTAPESDASDMPARVPEAGAATVAGESSLDASLLPGQGGEGFVSETAESHLKITEIVSGLILSPDGGRTRTAEEFRMIKRPLLDNAFNRDVPDGRHRNLIMISSSVQGEGKTFTSLNLAISITMELDSTVLLVDADVAKPGLSKALGAEDKPGLIDHLVDRREDLSGMLLRTDIPKLTVLPAGQKHKRSTELLASGNMKRLLDELSRRYPDRIVLFDSPPLLETSEASVLASLMGQVVIVVEYETTSQVVVKEALSQFENMDNVYLILNKCKENIFSGKHGYSYGYGYGYGYGSYGEK